MMTTGGFFFLKSGMRSPFLLGTVTCTIHRAVKGPGTVQPFLFNTKNPCALLTDIDCSLWPPLLSCDLKSHLLCVDPGEVPVLKTELSCVGGIFISHLSQTMLK